jgi:hypothetical protein
MSNRIKYNTSLFHEVRYSLLLMLLGTRIEGCMNGSCMLDRSTTQRRPLYNMVVLLSKHLE